MSFSTSDAFAQFAAHRDAELAQFAPAPAVKREAAPTRRLTEGEKVNLHNDANTEINGGIATAILTAPLLLLCPPVGIAAMAVSAGGVVSGLAKEATLRSQSEN
jgi:hypothetical protein